MLVGEVGDGAQVRGLCREWRSGVRTSGPAARDLVCYLQEHCPELKVLVLTAYVCGLVAVGVAGYVLKDAVPEAIVRAVHTVMQGGKWFSDTIVRTLAQQKLQRAVGSGAPLTDRRPARRWADRLGDRPATARG